MATEKKEPVQNFSKYDKMVNPRNLIDHPKNPNKHGQDQIDRLAELYKFHGIRHPIIVSKKTNFIVAGHGRKLAAIRAGLKQVPVVYQSFEDIDQEYAFMVADNAVALWSDLDLSSINLNIENLGPDFDIKMLGLKNFKLDPSEKKDKDGSKELNPDDFNNQTHECPKCGFTFNSTKEGDHE